jgi:signal recognition particle GTPase
VSNILQRRSNLIESLASVKQAEVGLKPRPSVVPFFVGRQDILDALNSAHVNGSSSILDGPTISVLAGLGGSGKTQTSLKFALEYERRYLYRMILAFLYLYPKDTRNQQCTL